MSVQRVSTSSYVSSPLSHWKYDVFLSFRGEDTRKNFTDHLYAALDQKGIVLFRDDKELERGKSISPALFKAIEESRISIIVFSRNYAYSTWCLDELVKIVECKNTSDHHHQQMVFPIFYDVEPTVVRKQTARFRKAFAKHEEVFCQNIGKVQKWRDALKEVANISGWELKDRNESEFIMDIVKEISSKIPTKSVTLKELVGIDSRLEKLRFLIDKEPNDARMIGICGMGGIGKTTLARVVYDLISLEFEGSSFLANVREISEKGGLITLQKQLLFQLKLQDNGIENVYDGINMIGIRLRHKKVLLVIDDVADIEQLEGLAGKHEWFGSGSRIIITSRDEHLLKTHGVDEVYRPKVLNYNEALQLFSVKAFKTHQPLEEYVELSEHVVKYAGGLPLALKVLGSFLFGRSTEAWESALKRLETNPENKILDILQISFDGLKESEKKIFLDVACFFKGEHRDYATKILDYCDFDPVIGIDVLIAKSLISIVGDNILWMHDLIQELGQQIVQRQSPEEPGKHSRLWKESDVNHVLTKNTGTEVVEGIKHFYFYQDEEVHLSASAKAFSKMTKLRILMIRNVQLPQGLKYLSDELRFLEWHGYPLKSLPSKFQPDKLVELDMCYSCIEQMWSGIKSLSKLKFMRLSNSINLIRTPDFSGVPNLEKLDLGGCTRLRNIHPSLLLHKKLILLNLKDCINLTTLPSKMKMKSIRKLVLSGCSKLKKFPEIVGSMECLLELFLDGTDIKELPPSIQFLSGLTLLDLENCTNLVVLPSTINGLTSLETLNLSGCSKSKNVLESSEKVESLEELELSGADSRNRVWSIFSMKNFDALSFLGSKLSQSSTLRYFHFPINLFRTRSSHPLSLRLPSLSNLCSLRKLDLSDCNLGEGAIPTDIGNLCSLKELYLSRNSFVSLPASINRLFKLEELELEDCKWLQFLPQLPPNIEQVRANGCISLGSLADALKLCKSQYALIRCMDCLKMLGTNNLAFSLLKEYLEAMSNSRFSIVVPGGEIPKWFLYRNWGSSITHRWPSYKYKKNKVVGYAICCVFRVHNHPPPTRARLHLSTHQLKFRIKDGGYFIDFGKKFGHCGLDHLWLLYFSSQYCNDQNWNLESDLVELSFWSDTGPGLEVIRCGFHPVYMHQVEEYDRTTYQWNLVTAYNLNGFHQNFDGSKMVVASTPKPSLTEYVGSEASGSGCCDDEEQEQQPKRS